jgi:gamma-glutamylaminecyclotransferase|tara:strand:+ start:2653 stop:3012 length:360 start_codon:yes stop_codon:yes gene_type:complete
MELVFVYGTLRQGHANHFIMRPTVKIGAGLTNDKYAMYVAGIPFLVEDEQVSKIKGELYAVDETTFEILDVLEGHPKWYERKKVDVTVEGIEHNAWVYFNEKQGSLNKSGDYAKRENNY